MSDKGKNKRLGQYFTGKELAKVLFELAHKINPNITTAIDPMMGKGDMLIAVRELDDSILTYGIELDKQLASKLTSQFKNNTKFVFSNAFENKTLQQLEQKRFDLVITNPPYVRHLNQRQESEFNGFTAPSGAQVRKDLIKSLEANKMIKEDEKHILLDIAGNYSGLSDLSVPSIIQCAALTKENGVLALVLPESCITREYSISTLILLFKLFDIKVIVKDEGRKWFKDAQVKTILLIGQKLEKPRKSFTAHPKISVVEISKATSDLPLGNNCFSENYNLFASTILGFTKPPNHFTGFNQYFNSVNSYLSPLLTKSSLRKYPNLKSLQVSSENDMNSLDARLKQFVHCTALIKLADLKIDINQGLRTGANKFFYFDFVSTKYNNSKVYSNIKSINTEIEIPNSYLKPALRKQNELLDRYFISANQLSGRLLVLNTHYTSSDFKKFALKSSSITELPSGLSEHISKCEILNIGTDDFPKYFPELSAVKTNISQNNGQIKTWYQLPDLKRRHLPDICIPRVNSKLVKSYLVEENVVVDANFLTINLGQDSSISVYGLLAIFNSNWIRVQLELSGNVLGAGALKIDRNHLLNLLIPMFSNTEYKELDKLGRNLITSLNYEVVLQKINDFINVKLKIADSTILRILLEQRLKLRTEKG